MKVNDEVIVTNRSLASFGRVGKIVYVYPFNRYYDVRIGSGTYKMLPTNIEHVATNVNATANTEDDSKPNVAGFYGFMISELSLSDKEVEKYAASGSMEYVVYASTLEEAINGFEKYHGESVTDIIRWNEMIYVLTPDKSVKKISVKVVIE